MRLSIRSLALGGLALLLATQASATVVLNYVGQHFTQVSTQGPTTPPDPFTTADSVSGFMELAAPLGANLVGSVVTPLSFSLFDGVNTFTNANATPSTFLFSTDASGQILHWQINASIFAPADKRSVGFTSQNYVDDSQTLQVGDDGVDTLCGPTSDAGGCAHFGDPFYSQIGRSVVPGAFSYVPEPGTLLLLGVGLAALAARRRLNLSSFSWIVLLASTVTATEASATVVSVVMGGSWHDVADTTGVLDGSVTAGTPFTLTMRYDDATPDLNSVNPNSGVYVPAAPPFVIEVATGNYTFTSVLQGPRQITLSMGGTDQVEALAQDVTATGGLPPLGFTEVDALLEDTTATALPSDALPDLPWVIADYDQRNVSVFAAFVDDDPLTKLVFNGPITSLTFVPEPGTLLLVGTGLAALAARRRSSRGA